MRKSEQAVFLSVFIRISLKSIIVSASPTDSALSYIEKHSKQYDRELLDLASIPSISSIPDHYKDVERAAEWLAGRLKKAGLKDVATLPCGSTPAVYGRSPQVLPDAPTVLIYGHYDVQPADPYEAWTSPPFEPVLEEGWFRGRGVSDDKGGVLQAIQAVEALIKTRSLRLNVKFLLEGQEEIGSPDLPDFLKRNARLLAADLALSADGGQLSEERGGVCTGLRGIVAFELEASTLSVDQHSGLKGGSVQNAIHALSEFLAGLRASNGRINVPAFYDGVRVVTQEEKSGFAAYPYNEEAELLAMGAITPHGEEGFTTLERRWVRPTLEVVGITGGVQQGIKTIVPSRATAKVTCRLVPDQDPAAVLLALEKYVAENAPAATNITFKALPVKARPFVTAPDLPTTVAAVKVLDELFGEGGRLLYRDGGSIPALAFMQEHLALDTTIFGFGLLDDNLHAPDERFRHSMYVKGRKAYVRILQELADQLGLPSPGAPTPTPHAGDEL